MAAAPARSAQMSHVAWSVSVCLSEREPIEMPFRALTHVSPRNHVLDGVTPNPPRKGHFEGDMRIVRLPPRANVPAQRTRRTNAFAAARCGRTTMRPFAKLFRTYLSNFTVLTENATIRYVFYSCLRTLEQNVNTSVFYKNGMRGIRLLQPASTKRTIARLKMPRF